MPGPHPATAKIRYAVRSALADLSPGDVVLVACSGGGDSMALAEAVAHEQRHAGWRAGVVVVDHGLQPGSDEVADRVAGWLGVLGLDPVEVARVAVAADGSGLEAAARDARHGALEVAAERVGAVAVLLGHTLDDQAEQVLLGLVRGSGARSLAGMPGSRGRLRRPLLAVTRAECRESCTAEGVPWWDDPMNADPAFARVRARRAVADLEADLGPGVAAALARSADQRREDADHRDALAERGSRRSSRRAPARAGPGSGAGCSARPVPRPGRWAPGTRRRATPSSRAGTVRARCTSPATCGWVADRTGSP